MLPFLLKFLLFPLEFCPYLCCLLTLILYHTKKSKGATAGIASLISLINYTIPRKVRELQRNLFNKFVELIIPYQEK